VTGSAGTAGATGLKACQDLPDQRDLLDQQALLDKGNDGTSVVIKGSVATHQLSATGNTLGDLWIALDTSHGWVWST
jgi:hypothetical protein